MAYGGGTESQWTLGGWSDQSLFVPTHQSFFFPFCPNTSFSDIIEVRLFVETFVCQRENLCFQ